MELAVAGFDWDSGNWPKCGKHGVTKKEIEDFFRASPAVMTPTRMSRVCVLSGRQTPGVIFFWSSCSA